MHRIIFIEKYVESDYCMRCIFKRAEKDKKDGIKK